MLYSLDKDFRQNDKIILIKDEQIINLNIMGGHRVLPNSATHFYSATKFSVRALTGRLQQELRQLKSGIRVVTNMSRYG
jgi:NADP-dependent 3-hydroxy acid dehydrogenase YdfG